MKEKEELVFFLNDYLLHRMKEFHGLSLCFQKDYASQRKLLRSLVNLSRLQNLGEGFYERQDRLLQIELEEKGVISPLRLVESNRPRIALYQGDVTRLKVDVIVNPAKENLLGCFVPGHDCVDNDIHSAAGLQLREECFLFSKERTSFPPAFLYVSKPYNLLSKSVFHIVGPKVDIRPTTRNEEDLTLCYWKVMEEAEKRGAKTIAIPSISTGEFRYPLSKAVRIAVDTIDCYLTTHPKAPVVIFCIKKDEEFLAYSEILES